MSRLLKNLEAAESTLSSELSATSSPLQPKTQCFYSNTASLPFSKDKAGLASWLSTRHPHHNMASLDFYGHLIDDNGKIIGFSSMIQQQFGLPGGSIESRPYLAEFSICNDETNGVVVAPFMLEEDKVSFQADPYSETAHLKLLTDPEKITIALVSGQMGQPGAVYKLTGNAFAFDFANWVYEVELTDKMGTIAVGYGPQSFLPQWLDTQQQETIKTQYGGSVSAYLQAGQDDMKGQGSYYYSLPMLEVNHFKITVDGLPFASGSQGHLWVDYVTQSFSEASYPVLKNDAMWQFLAIQFPPQLSLNNFTGALMFSQVEMPVPGKQETSTLPTARFYHSGASQQPNSAMNAWHEWDMQDIQFKSSDPWPANSKPQFPLKFTLTLGNQGDPNGYAVLHGEAVRKDQEVKEVKKYEGIYKITGALHVNNYQLDTVNGYAWAEIH